MRKPNYPPTDYDYSYPPSRSNGGGILTTLLLLTLALVAAGLVLHFGAIFLATLPRSGASVSAPAVPTMSNVERFYASQEAPRTAQEQQAIVQPTPIVVPTQPPAQPSALNAPGTALSPVDLVYAPVATPVSILSQEQLDASAASEEQNQLNTQLSGLTPAQQVVAEHDAAWKAKHP